MNDDFFFHSSVYIQQPELVKKKLNSYSTIGGADEVKKTQMLKGVNYSWENKIGLKKSVKFTRSSTSSCFWNETGVIHILFKNLRSIFFKFLRLVLDYVNWGFLKEQPSTLTANSYFSNTLSDWRCRTFRALSFYVFARFFSWDKPVLKVLLSGCKHTC